MGSRKQAVRFGSVLAGAAIAVMATALPATAATTGKVLGGDNPGQLVRLDYVKDGKHVAMAAPTTLIGVQLGDQKAVETYCVELDVETAKGAPMHEAQWDKYPNPNNKFRSDRAKVNWVLHNSFPAMKVEDVATESRVAGLTQQEAIAGTQAAIWHFSNDATLAEQGNDPRTVALYKFLTSQDNHGIADEPKPTLAISKDELAGHAGDKIGPFTLATTATGGVVSVTGPSGLKLVDEDGKELPGQAEHRSVGEMKDLDRKSTFFVKVPANLAPGNAQIKVDSDAILDEGRLFVGDTKTQTLIIAKSEKVTVSAASKVTWAAATPGSASQASSMTTPAVVVATSPKSAPSAPAAKTAALANTGVSIWPAVGIATLLLAAGGGALVVQRRRNRA